jgi:hypothetical protein
MEPETRPPSDVKTQGVETLSIDLLATQAMKRAAYLDVLEGRATPRLGCRSTTRIVVADDCWLQIGPRPGPGPGPGQRLYFRVAMGRWVVGEWTVDNTQ